MDNIVIPMYIPKYKIAIFIIEIDQVYNNDLMRIYYN